MTDPAAMMPGYGRAAAKLSLNPAEQELPPLPILPTTPPSPVPPPAPAMPTAAPTPAPAAPMNAPGAGYPAPGAPAPFWKVRQQADGSSIDYIELPDGTERVLAVHEAPKLPRAYQPAQPGVV